MNKKKLIKESFEFLRESKKHILIISLLFLISVITGLIFLPESFTLLDEMIRDIILKVGDKKGISLWFFIFSNNIFASAVSLFAGVFFGVYSLVSAIFNGLLIGYVLHKAIQVQGILSIFQLIPHGIFELPAILISMSLGLRLGLSFFTKDIIKTLKQRTFYSITIFITLIIPLLILASIIETLLIHFLG